MTKESYKAWDGKKYKWPPPQGWYLADDDLWWPQGYGPKKSPAGDDGAMDTPVKEAASSVSEDTPERLISPDEAASAPSLLGPIPEGDAYRSSYEKIEDVARAAEVSDDRATSETFEVKDLTDEYNVIETTNAEPDVTYKAAASSLIDKLSDEKTTETKNFAVEPDSSFSFDGAKQDYSAEVPTEPTKNSFQSEKITQPAEKNLLEHGALPTKSSHIEFTNSEKVVESKPEEIISKEAKVEPVNSEVPAGRMIDEEEPVGKKKFLTFFKFLLVAVFLGLLVYGGFFIYDNYFKVKEGSFESPHSQGWDVSLGLPSEESSLWILQVSEAATVVSADSLPGDVVEPLAGNVYLRAPVQLQRKEGAVLSSLSVFDFSVASPGKKFYPLSQECSIATDSLDLGASLSSSETVTGFLCWEVPQEDAKSMVLAVSAEEADNEVYITLQ